MKISNILKPLNCFLGTVYVIIIIKAFESRGIQTFQFFCAYNWLGLALIHYSLSIFGSMLYQNKIIKYCFNLSYGGAFTMSYIISKYWEDAFENFDHFFAHYIPTVVTLIHVIQVNSFNLINTCLFQLIMFIIVRNPDQIYEIEFYDRYYDLVITCVAPYVTAEVIRQVIKQIKNRLKLDK
ncbi:Conserved_hypothetical protein [Hexamita inflata]|uniref:Transmembrane protein n=1 Tax=Hexamita inflata TaxID=28002 RepID=A0AA86R6J1_9EUKA|nr:Conserved hypothetical protein [Hexamita inflata]